MFNSKNVAAINGYDLDGGNEIASGNSELRKVPELYLI
jgi:hypothetical protein